MDQILNTVGQTIDDIVNSQAVQITGRLIFIYLVSCGSRLPTGHTATCSSAPTTRSCRTWSRRGIILFTPFLLVLAVWVYKIIRPHEKIGEVWERNLAEEALLNEVEAVPHCPTCERRVDDGMDHLPVLSHAAQPRLPELFAAGRPRLVAVCVVRQGLRAS